ncbi:dolichol kinase EVAN-like isoform X1 [Phoenix dactylifera]|uniref:dolichol kinase n=1 Tax=Phoenix dactylifera TaxID=42345 RepID=A0A8B7CJK4_PHODC|nr:dolichol kinase EVAN-like isoform X1 [Phoenix dactylifera]
MTGVAELCNGERAVVFLFVSRVIYSAPLSLSYEAAALCLLAVAGLVIEISAESSTALDRFKTRPGASSGIQLGAVTLPTVMLSRLIQLSRALLREDVEPEELAYMSMQYWTVSASCFGVLIFFCLLLRRSSNGASFFHLGSSQASKYSLLHTVLYVLTCYLSFATKSDNGWFVTKNLLWLLCHGLVTVFLIQHILQTFPMCASIGEALLVSSGLVLYFGDILGHTVLKIDFLLLSSQLNFKEYGSRSEIATVIQGLLLGFLLLPVFYKSLLQIWVYFANSSKLGEQAAEGWKYRSMGSSVVFYASLLVMLTILAPAWMYFVQDFHVHPLLWVFLFVFTDPLKRLALCIYWICVICASILRFYSISKHSKIERILLRKYYHLVAVLMFLPALLFQPSFLDLAFGAALAVFLVLEMIRVWKIWPLGHIVHQFMNAFTDHRDSEILIISHFSLLLGCALPKWMSSGFNDRPLAPFAGILSLGIGDTMASLVGHKYGVLRWSKTGKKTIEGTAAGITSVLAACSILLPLLASTGYILSQRLWAPSSLPTFLCAPPPLLPNPKRSLIATTWPLPRSSIWKLSRCSSYCRQAIGF